MNKLKAPFPYFGGKSRVADVIWRALGNPKNYIEPFCGSAAVLLSRPPSQPTDAKYRNEIIGDLDCYIVNFWRAMKHNPNSVAEYAEHLNSQADMNARHIYLLDARKWLSENVKKDPEYYDAKCAGYWVYGMSCWIGWGWTNEKYRGASKKNRASPVGIFSERLQDIGNVFSSISERLKRVIVVNDKWEKTCSAPYIVKDDCGVFFDPPYSEKANRDNNVYAQEDLVVAHAVREWCISNQEICKIVLAGYSGEHEELEGRGWRVYSWSSGGGTYGKSSGVNSRGKSNRHKERLWISPLCERIDESATLLDS